VSLFANWAIVCFQTIRVTVGKRADLAFAACEACGYLLCVACCCLSCQIPEDSCMLSMRSKRAAGEQHGRLYKSFAELWSGSFRFLSLSDTKQRCLHAVLARTRTRGRSALCATKPITSRANAPTKQALLRLRLLLLLLRHLQQDHTRAPLPLQSLRLRRLHGSRDWWFILSTLRLLSQILRLRHSHLGPLGQVLRLHPPSHPPLHQSLQL